MFGIFSITQFGKPLDKSLYTIDLTNKIFGSNENELVLDFYNLRGWNFTTGSYCTFRTGGSCTFYTGTYCTFKTGGSCIFKTGYDCTFMTGLRCKFNTDEDCTFKTGSRCTFMTGLNCTFRTSTNCTFKTGECCTFMLWKINTCKFKTYDNMSIILDRTDNQHYILTKELIDMMKVING